jgi:uncharacterized protein YhbP (UPF0306 family)
MSGRLPFSDLLELPALTLATSGPAGEPHAASVYFVCDDHLTFYFLSAPHSQHSRDLALCPSAAITVDPAVERWQDIRGLQMRGLASEVTSRAQVVVAWARYLAKFPYVKGLESEVLKNRWHAFSPQWVRWIDNRVRFGHKQEWSGDALRQLTGRREP